MIEAFCLLLGLLVGFLIGLILAASSLENDGYTVKDGHIVSKGYKVTIDPEAWEAIAEILRKYPS